MISRYYNLPYGLFHVNFRLNQQRYSSIKSDVGDQSLTIPSGGASRAIEEEADKSNNQTDQNGCQSNDLTSQGQSLVILPDTCTEPVGTLEENLRNSEQNDQLGCIVDDSTFEEHTLVILPETCEVPEVTREEIFIDNEQNDQIWCQIEDSPFETNVKDHNLAIQPEICEESNKTQGENVGKVEQMDPIGCQQLYDSILKLHLLFFPQSLEMFFENVRFEE